MVDKGNTVKVYKTKEDKQEKPIERVLVIDCKISNKRNIEPTTSNLKSNKSTGPDDLPNVLFIADPKTCSETNTVPNEWKSGLFVMLLK